MKKFFPVLALFAAILSACAASPEEKLVAGYFDSLYGEKRSDFLQARMLPFFAEEVKNKRLPVYSARARLSEKVREHAITGWHTSEEDGRLTVSGTVSEKAPNGTTTRKGFITRFSKQYAPSGKQFIWMLYDIVFSSQPLGDTKPWLQLVSLSPAARSLVEGITNKVEVLLFGRFADDPVVHVLREIAACIPEQVSFAWLDPDVDRGLAASYGITRAPHIVIESGPRRAILQVSDLYQNEGPSEEQSSRVLMAERKLVAALCRVAGRLPKIDYITDLLTRETSGVDTRAVTQFVLALSNSGYLVKGTSLAEALATSSSNTNQSSLFIFADPRLGVPAELDSALMEQLRQGKTRALFLMDTPLGYWGAQLAARFGFLHLNATVVDPANKDSFKGPRWIESLLSTHDAVRHFARRPNFRVLIAEAAGFLPLTNQSTNFISVPLISTSSNGWAETEFDHEKPDEFEYEPGKDIPGPIRLGFAVKGADKEGRPVAIFIGDCDFIANELAQSRISNWLFTSDLLDWLLWPEVQGIASRPCPVGRFKQLQ